MSNELAMRRTAIHLLRSGKTVGEVAQEVGRSIAWVYKWRKRFLEAGGDWRALEDRSRAPHHPPKKLSESIRQKIRMVRSELEVEAAKPGKLSYIGAHAIRGRLRKQRIKPLPSITSIERELRAAGMTKPRNSQLTDEIEYPHMHPRESHQLVQVDIVPRYLPGGPCVACFNAIDVVSRLPTGRQYLSKRSIDAINFLLEVWRDLGIPTYTQVDNESCFSGGFTLPGVLGKVLRLALLVGTELVFSPIRHPESNGYVERFHQDYTKNVWDKIDLPDLGAVHRHSLHFFGAYRQSLHHSALDGYSPQEMHKLGQTRNLPANFNLPAKLPLTVGKAHFIRRVSQDRQIMVLNLKWVVPSTETNQGVWATLQFMAKGAKLRIFDAAPDAKRRSCLAVYSFPLTEPVCQLDPQFQRLNIPFERPRLTVTVAGIARTLGQWISTMF
jgi:transposase/transposase InsO family protein